ncbi:MAG: heavy metal translocating P-type ATPase metal-binding domain-containing protein [Sphingobacteriia bacterium]|nr:heavy metal translocating P-type ATPase metal-binding domain-containing protein [Sphingobacteriia bacterium]
MSKIIEAKVQCYHCGETCVSVISANDKHFCCEGCKMVYEILNRNGLCNYYELAKNPGTSQKIKVRENKFSFLNDAAIANSLISFKDDEQTHIGFYLPQIHCSSCLWLLENLHKINDAVISSKVNFERKEAFLVFNHNKISLQKVAELLTSIGYEPYISLHQLENKKAPLNKSKIYKLGVAGFCFANIMLLSFPEYLGIDTKEQNLMVLFRYLNVLLSLPVFFYSASEFYISAWKGLQHKFLNIDAPIVLSVLVTFARSLYEVFSGTGLGYFDSMSGIVFFMLVGRVLQDRTYQQLSFDRDYTSYFPIAVTRIKEKQEESVALPSIQLNDTLLIHHQELIPADGILTRGKALIDYSFVTGESIPVEKEMGEIIYAGGKQIGSNIEMLVIKEVAQSYLTGLWNREEFKKQSNKTEHSFVHLVSRYFTWGVFTIAFFAGVYWYLHDTSKVWNTVTAVLIVACPCALLLSNTFTNGNILRILSRNHFFIKNAQTIEELANINFIVFDKTGTLTYNDYSDVQFDGKELTDEEKRKITALAAQSTHPLSKAIVQYLQVPQKIQVTAFKEHSGNGIEGFVGGDLVKIGSLPFISGSATLEKDISTNAYVSIEDKVMGRFILKNHYRKHIAPLLQKLSQRYPVAVLSGDNAGEQKFLQKILGFEAQLLFNQKPIDKLNAIRLLQQNNKKVLMVGDGLNDAGALKQADVGIAVTENSNSFTPASDGILEASQLPILLRFIKLCKANRKIVLTAFIISVLYNIIGLAFAVQGILQPVVAAILMPCSSISILLITFGLSNLISKFLKLSHPLSSRT